MILARKKISNVNFCVFCFELIENIEAGWEIDENSPPLIYGIAYEADLIKEDKTVKVDFTSSNNLNPSDMKDLTKELKKLNKK